MTRTDSHDEAARVEHLRELVALGATRAARAIGELASVRVEAGALSVGAWTELPGFDSAVLFEVEGRLGGGLALSLDAASRRMLLRRLLGAEESAAPADTVASALAEVANIVASQSLSAIADALGGKISHSVPRAERSAAALADWMSERAAGPRSFVAVCELCAPRAGLRLQLLFALDA
jgi:chemotaxis protein CheY-P-specific phosphatase CheC